MVMVSAGLSAGERTQGATASCETGTTSNDPDTPGAGVARTCHVIVKSDFWRSDDATRQPAPARARAVRARVKYEWKAPCFQHGLVDQVEQSNRINRQYRYSILDP